MRILLEDGSGYWLWGDGATVVMWDVPLASPVHTAVIEATSRTQTQAPRVRTATLDEKNRTEKA